MEPLGKEKPEAAKNKKQKVLFGIFVASMTLKILLLFGFAIYLYFWIKGR